MNMVGFIGEVMGRMMEFECTRCEGVEQLGLNRHLARSMLEVVGEDKMMKWMVLERLELLVTGEGKDKARLDSTGFDCSSKTLLER